MRAFRSVPVLVLLVMWDAPALARPDGRRLLDLPVPAPSGPAAARLVLGARDDLEVTSERRSQTMSHIRLQQRAPDGTRVVGSDTAVHLAGTAPLYTARLGQAAPGRVAMTGARRLDLDAATRTALAAVPGVIESREAVAVAVPGAPGTVRPAVLLAVDTGRALLEVLVDADSGQVSVGEDLRVRVDGSGRVYRPNPITESGDLELVDGDGADTPELTSLLEEVTLRGLDGSGALRGEFADAHRLDTRLSQANLTFTQTRGQPGFGEISAYYHVDRAQRYVQSLGFTGPSGIRAEPLDIVTDYTSEDQSFFDSVTSKLELGTGGVDDAEDGDVVVHEYGHALEYFIVPRFGRGSDARGLGEGWGDTLAATVPTLSNHPAMVDRACLGPWDASAYDPPQPCIRRVDGQQHYPEGLAEPREPHSDGEIWSGTLHDLFAQPDIGADAGLRLVLESMYLYADNESFAAAGAALLAADTEMTGGAHAATLRRVLLWHGILSDLTARAPEGEVAESVTTDIGSPGGSGVDAVETIAAPGAPAIRVHFASLALATAASCPGSMCDGVYIYDKAGNLYAHLGGTGSDVDGPIVPGDEVRVRLITRQGSTGRGYVIDRYDVVLSAVTPDGGVADAATAPDGSPAPPDAATTGAASGGCQLAAGQGGGGWAGPVLVTVVLARLALTLAARGAPRRRRPSRS